MYMIEKLHKTGYVSRFYGVQYVCGLMQILNFYQKIPIIKENFTLILFVLNYSEPNLGF